MDAHALSGCLYECGTGQAISTSTHQPTGEIATSIPFKSTIYNFPSTFLLLATFLSAPTAKQT